MRQVVVMVTSSYPRFPGDGVGSFIEPIAKGLAARGHEIHLVAPWHPAITRPKVDEGVIFHFFRYAPVVSLNVFGYAEGLRADTELRAAAWAAAPLAIAAGWFKAWRVAAKRSATVMHGHWVIPSGVMAAMAARRLPLVLSLHGSDVYVAERHAITRIAARLAFNRAAWITGPSDDLCRRAQALGADPARLETLPYGVDAVRFAPDPQGREQMRRELDVGDAPLIFSAGRLVRKKGFEFLIEAIRRLLVDRPAVRLVIAGAGDLHDELSVLAAAAGRDRVRLLGDRSQTDISRMLMAADVTVVPSVRDDRGNVDGLPNFALEALASGTPVVATRAGGLPQAIDDGVNGLLVPERDPAALAAAIDALLKDPSRARALGQAAREKIVRQFGWARVAERFEAAYERSVTQGRADHTSEPAGHT
jgi:glycosyltransferase involved in cell wall biosynthesis